MATRGSLCGVGMMNEVREASSAAPNLSKTMQAIRQRKSGNSGFVVTDVPLSIVDVGGRGDVLVARQSVFASPALVIKRHDPQACRSCSLCHSWSSISEAL